MTPRARSKSAELDWSKLAPEVQTSLRAGLEEAKRGEFADMSPEETEHYLETGELPERVERWLDSYDSHHGI